MPANFTPTFEPYTGQRPFRWWCQKVLPLVYDDSLSYYELLCKVVTYLNNVITDVANVEGNLDELRDAFIELQDYVNEYLTDARMQQMVNNKLDEMAEDGTLDVVLNSLTHLEVKMDGTTVFETADDYGRSYAMGLKLASYDEGNADIGLVLAGLKNQADTAIEYTDTNDTYGLTAKMYMHQNVVTLTIKTDDEGLDAELPTSSAYVSFSMHQDMKPKVSVQMYVLIGAQYTAQLNVLQNGTIQIGYTKAVADGSAVNVPANTLVRCGVTFLSAHGLTYDSYTAE